MMIRGELVDLRLIVESDLDMLETWMADSDYNGEFNSFGLQPFRRFRKSFAEHGRFTDEHGTLLIVTKGGEFAGDISYRRAGYGPGTGNNAFELGITVAAAHRGRGFGAEAQRLLAAYLLATYPIARVQASTDITNIAEQRTLERAGFTREGVLRRAQFRAGDWHDLVMYSKLRGE
jgi:RimJ/RimL family protein N-acetyltransferase